MKLLDRTWLFISQKPFFCIVDQTDGEHRLALGPRHVFKILSDQVPSYKAGLSGAYNSKKAYSVLRKEKILDFTI